MLSCTLREAMPPTQFVRPLPLGELACVVAQLGCDRGLHQHVPLRVQSVPAVGGVNVLVDTAWRGESMEPACGYGLVAGAVATEGLGWLRGTSRPTAGAAREADRIIIHTYIHGRSYKGIGPPRKAETRQTKEQPQSTQVTFNRRRSQISQRIPPQKLPTWAVARYPSAHQPCTHA